MEHQEWLDNLIGDDSRRTAAVRAKTPNSTLARQYENNRLTPEMVIALCRAYELSPISGLIATGYLNSDESTGDVPVEFALEKASRTQLLHEIDRRFRLGEA